MQITLLSEGIVAQTLAYLDYICEPVISGGDLSTFFAYSTRRTHGGTNSEFQWVQGGSSGSHQSVPHYTDRVLPRTLPRESGTSICWFSFVVKRPLLTRTAWPHMTAMRLNSPTRSSTGEIKSVDALKAMPSGIADKLTPQEKAGKIAEADKRLIKALNVRVRLEKSIFLFYLKKVEITPLFCSEQLLQVLAERDREPLRERDPRQARVQRGL